MHNFLKRFRKPCLTLALIFVCLLVWQIAALSFDVPLILPSPFPVIGAFFRLLTTSLFWKSIGLSFLRIFSGACIGLLVGFFAGILCAISETVRTLISPLFSVIRATPVACFIILAWVFIGSKSLPIFIAALMVAPVMMTGTLTGLKSTPKPLLEAAHQYRLSLLQTARTCYIPALLPHTNVALMNCIGLAWKAGIAAEIIVKTELSIGYEIWNAKSWNIDSVQLFAWTLAVIIISLLFEGLFRYFLSNRKKESSHAS